MKRGGSEPDLQAAISRDYQEDDSSRYKARKKYKAPSPPAKEEQREEPDGSPMRKPRLFKTRAETKKKSNGPSDEEFKEEVQLRDNRPKEGKANRLSLPEMKRSQSMPEFQQELKEVTERLRHSKHKLKTLDKKQATKGEPPQPAKMFYFGMDEPVEKTNAVDRFASNYHTNGYHPSNSSGSDLSSEYEMDDLTNHGIALQLRPILPKKQLEIPRFSPAAAWRLLSSVESAAGSTVASEDGPVFVEDRIEKLSRPPPPPAMQFGHRSSHDKSGDSGISGDAGPAPFDEGIENNTKLRGMAWTPQQDLGDDSSADEGQNVSRGKRFTSGPHVFSLSLPREQHLESYFGEKAPLQHYSGLQRFRKSVTGVLGNLASKRDSDRSQNSNNWFLSKSAPNSLNNGFNSIEHPKPQKSEGHESSLVPSNSKHNSGRLMYLPELENVCQARARIKSKPNVFSKSCENISMEVKSSSEPEDLQDPPRAEPDNWRGHKPKKFTFQSTVRQIERRRLAEKLSREAERKEQQRLRELEAMQRVEEEFQKKRAREKASIRQQLRLYSMDDSGWSSLPPNLEARDDLLRPEPDGAVSSAGSSPSFLTKTGRKQAAKRTVSSDSSEENVSKPPGTQVLSEYRQPQREYKEFRSSPRYHHQEEGLRQTVHPQVTCNMPKARGNQSNLDGSCNTRVTNGCFRSFERGRQW